MIGSAGRNAGKTDFACSLLRKFGRDQSIIGIKVTTIDRKDGSCPRGGTGCGVCSSLSGDFCITEETGVPPRKDTSRLLAAGARRVFWLRVVRAHLVEGASELLNIMGPDAVSICESNSLRTVVEPGLFFMVRNRRDEDHYKKSAAEVMKYADRTVLFDGNGFDTDLADIGLVDGNWRLLERATAIVLVGGVSKRMKQDKGMLLINGRPMIEHVCSQLRGNFDQILVSASDSKKYAFLGLDIIPDEVPLQGPLMGMVSALAASSNDLNLVVACDIPEIDITFARQMLAEAEKYDVVIPRTADGMLEPLFAVYRKSVLSTMKKVLSSGERRVRAIFDHCNVKYVHLSDGKRPRNLNTMEEYRAYIKNG